jgi:hypothetical protein
LSALVTFAILPSYLHQYPNTMNSSLKNAVIVILVAVIAGLLLYFLPKAADEPDSVVNPADVQDFLTCADAGYPVMESDPRQCRTPDGRLFVEDTTENAEVVINTPMIGQRVTSPLTVSGKAKGTWFFEDNLPVTLKDKNGKVLAQKGAQSQDGQWMTTDYVNFTVVLEFDMPATDEGSLFIEKDNPSGLPEHAGSFFVPVRFR